MKLTLKYTTKDTMEAMFKWHVGKFRYHSLKGLYCIFEKVKSLLNKPVERLGLDCISYTNLRLTMHFAIDTTSRKVML